MWLRIFCVCVCSCSHSWVITRKTKVSCYTQFQLSLKSKWIIGKQLIKKNAKKQSQFSESTWINELLLPCKTPHSCCGWLAKRCVVTLVSQSDQYQRRLLIILFFSVSLPLLHPLSFILCILYTLWYYPKWCKILFNVHRNETRLLWNNAKNKRFKMIQDLMFHQHIWLH